MQSDQIESALQIEWLATCAEVQIVYAMQEMDVLKVPIERAKLRTGVILNVVFEV